MPQTSRTVVPFAADAIRGVEEMTSQKPAKSRFSASVENNFSFLTRPPLLRSESEQEFNQLLSGLKAEIQPHGLIEDMYVADTAIIIWEILRLRRCKMAILKMAFQEGLRGLIDKSSWQQLPPNPANSSGIKLLSLEPSDSEREWLEKQSERSRKVTDLTNRWFSSESVRQKVSRILSKSQRDEFEIEARAIQDSFTDIEWIEKMLTALEARRDKALRRIAEYRQSFADRVRASADRIVDSEPSPLPRLEDGTEKSAA